MIGFLFSRLLRVGKEVAQRALKASIFKLSFPLENMSLETVYGGICSFPLETPSLWLEQRRLPAAPEQVGLRRRRPQGSLGQDAVNLRSRWTVFLLLTSNSLAKSRMFP